MMTLKKQIPSQSQSNSQRFGPSEGSLGRLADELGVAPAPLGALRARPRRERDGAFHCHVRPGGRDVSGILRIEDIIPKFQGVLKSVRFKGKI